MKLLKPGLLCNAANRKRLIGLKRTSVMFLVTLLGLGTSALAENDDSEELIDCLIEPWLVSEVGSPVQGVLDKVVVDLGEAVSEGQPLAQLESGVEEVEVALAKARASAKSEMQAREAEVKLASLENSRIRDLYAQKLTTTQQRDEAAANLEVALAARAQASERIETLDLELKRAHREYARRIVTSPFDGVVVEVSAYAGEFVYDIPIMTIAVLDELRVEATLPSRLFGSISQDDIVYVYPELQEGDALSSVVDAIDPILDSRSGTFGVRLKLQNSDHAITAGQICQLSFEPHAAAANKSSEQGSAETKTP